MFEAAFGLIFMTALLAVAAATPIVNLFAFGYLMEVQGRVARTGKFRSAFYLLPAARQLGGILLAVSLWLMPVGFLAEATRDVWLLAPTGVNASGTNASGTNASSPIASGTAAWLWTIVLIVASLLIAAHLLMAIGCGGRWWSFLRPIRNFRFLRDRLRRGDYWQDAHHAIREFVAAFRLPHLFRLGLLGYGAVYLWSVIPLASYTMLEDTTIRWQIVVFLLGGAALTITLMWLPLLLAHVAVYGRWAAMFEIAAVRRLAGQTPLWWAVSTAILLICSVLPLLYTALFKIRIPTHDAMWDVMIVFLVSVVPARVLVGWVYYRAARKDVSPATWPWRIWQWTVCAALCAGVGFYVYFLNLAATGGELGERCVWQMHALLLPLSF
jgi:hypothetical protein